MRILVCGSRVWRDRDLINKTLCAYWISNNCETLTIIHGGAKGADSIAARIAKLQGQKAIEFKAEWDKYGKAAGPIRNQQMLDEGKPDIVLAFSKDIENSRGTKDMVKRARGEGIKTIVITGEE